MWSIYISRKLMKKSKSATSLRDGQLVGKTVVLCKKKFRVNAERVKKLFVYGGLFLI